MMPYQRSKTSPVLKCVLKKDANSEKTFSGGVEYALAMERTTCGAMITFTTVSLLFFNSAINLATLICSTSTDSALVKHPLQAKQSFKLTVAFSTF